MNTEIIRLAANILAVAKTRREIGAEMTARGISASEDRGNIRAAIEHIRAIVAHRAERKQRIDPLLRASTMRPHNLRRIREERKRQNEINKIMSAPIAAHWRSDRREMVAGSYDPEIALHYAVAATLEAVSRIATSKWGFERRHTSRSSGRADSRYLVLEGVGEVRISNHSIPVYGERAWRYEETGGPNWGEIIIGRHELGWTVTRWRRELILRAAGRR